MLRYILKRLLQGVFVLIGVSIVIFCLSRIIPGDPARLALGQHATQEAVDNLSKQMYLDKPLPVQYILWFLPQMETLTFEALYSAFQNVNHFKEC